MKKQIKTSNLIDPESPERKLTIKIDKDGRVLEIKEIKK